MFEAAAPGSGQSAGRTRVFRHGHDDERLVRLAIRARGEWERLEQVSSGLAPAPDAAVPAAPPDITKNQRAFEIMIKNASFRLVRAMASRDAERFLSILEELAGGSPLFTTCFEAIVGAGEPILRRAQQAGSARADVTFDDVLRLISSVTMAPGMDPVQRARIAGIVIDGLRRRD